MSSPSDINREPPVLPEQDHPERPDQRIPPSNPPLPSVPSLIERMEAGRV